MKIKMIATVIGIILLVLVIATFLVITFSPQFGNTPSKEQKAEFEKLDNYEKGKFVNQIETVMNIRIGKMLKQMFGPSENRSPEKDIDPLEIDSLDIVNWKSAEARLTWFGHSAFLLEINDKIILIDPMLGERPAPFSWTGPKRYSNDLPIAIEKLPAIDAVILSHDHYDHLDYGSIIKLKAKTQKFYTALGVGSHLVRWGVDPEKIEELNWWDETQLDEIKLTCTPSRHFSGRSLFDRNATLWCSWIINTDSSNIYFSGDGGYGPHFKEIGERYGPFDISLMECGQYNEQWQAIHMMPEETVQAAIDVRSKLLLPIHWGAFTLAFHEWTDPVERAKKAADSLGMPITTPAIGQSVYIGNEEFPSDQWWKAYTSK
jgi:L-ascorbate metabolism protein UlaG (beta-lactamase superfamily)